jgi:hypothetical protein
MSAPESFEDLDAWKAARELAREVYALMTYLMLDNQFILPPDQKALLGRCIRTGKLVSGLIRSLDNRS